ncbi:DUF2284 domain-containing protein [Desulfobacula sp.]
MTAGFERAFQLFMDSCCFCKDCTGNREICKQPRMARPAPEAMAVDVTPLYVRLDSQSTCFQIMIRKWIDLHF